MLLLSEELICSCSHAGNSLSYPIPTFSLDPKSIFSAVGECIGLVLEEGKGAVTDGVVVMITDVAVIAVVGARLHVHHLMSWL